jgi:hypothetical protein
MAQIITRALPLVLAAVLGGAITLFLVGPWNAGSRYAIVSVGSGQIHRLDTATGEIRAYILAPEEQARSTLRSVGPLHFVEIGAMPGGAQH